MKRLLFVALFAAATAHAQVVAEVSGGIAVAREGRLDVYDGTGSRILHSFDSVSHPSKIVTGEDTLAVLDSWSNEAHVVDLKSGAARTIQTMESPIDGHFDGHTLFVLARDAATLQRFGPDGPMSAMALDADPAFMRAWADKLIIYSRREGSLQMIAMKQFVPVRRLSVAAGAADLELDRTTGYLVYPDEAMVRTFSLSSFEATGEVRTGGVPVDISVVRESSTLSPARLSIADPSSKRIWSVEGRQSDVAAFARGFVRGFIGLGFRPGRNADFPTGIDRVETRQGRSVAYDSSTGTLYRIDEARPTAIGRGVPPAGFAIVAHGTAVWENDRLTVRPLHNPSRK